jgi:DNA polymerase-3 subunit gamma/tau
MEYQALYRKYRPQRFAEVIGQTHVTTTLAREVVAGKIAHAYLFTGPRGTGKTTTARLLAKSLNCADRRDDGEPCNECLSCVAVSGGVSLDVIELDAASHNKVEDVREIRANVGTVAIAGGARKVYILDEAHMLSRAAGNALLKTLEEPPEHVIFMLATTEPYKLLDTIRSRAQRFDFLPVPADVLTDFLGDIATREGMQASMAGLASVATHAKGSVRDGLSLLEQVAALGGGEVEAEVVSRALGLADRDAFGKLAAAVAAQDAPAALALVAELAARGGDLRRFVAEAMGFFRGIFLAQYAPNLEEIADEPMDTLDEWRRYAKQLSAAEVLRAVDQLSEALLHLRQGREERIVTELALIRLTRPETVVSADALTVRLDRLEQRWRDTPSGGGARGSRRDDDRAEVEDRSSPPPRTAPPPPPPQVPAAASDDGEAAAPPGQVEPIVDLTLATFESTWPALAARMRDVAGPSRHALLKEATPATVDGANVTFTVPSHLPFHLEQLRADHELHDQLGRVAAEMLGGSITVQFVAADATTPPDAATEDGSGRAPDKDDLLESGPAADDPTELVVDLLGGEVIDDGGST